MSVELREIHKHFGPVRANDGVTLTIESGTLHGLLGENGAGKSTLMKVLSGFHTADGGEIEVDGELATFRTPDDAIRHGIGMLHQDPLVFLPFSVVDNFLLGSPGPARLDRAEAARHLADLCDRFDFSLDPRAPARTLTVGERQQLEIVRLLWLGARVLILDEPTTGISATQRGKLFAALRSLAGEGMSVVFVSHKLEEVEQLCDRATVMRSGKVVGEREMPCPAEELVELMFGQVIVSGERRAVPLGAPVLEVEQATMAGQVTTVEEVSLTVRAGEVVGLAGLEGSGQRTLLRACAGLHPLQAGRVVVGGRDVTRAHYRDFLASGVQYLPAGRLEEGLVAGLTLTEHFALRHSGGFFVDWRRAEERADREIRTHHIVGRPDSPAEALSGGNQQRLLLGMLEPELTLLLMEHPTRGLDIESASWVWDRLLERRATGTGIVFASADLDELLLYSDRIVVFFSGRVLEVVDTAATTPRSRRRPDAGITGALVAVLVALLVAVLLLLVVGTSPWEALRLLFEGSFGSRSKIADTLMAWVPLVLAAAGLVITFTAGLWNIGIEGQIVAGAVAAALVARVVTAPAPVLVALTLLAGMVGGALWALAAGALRTFGKVNEIFGGLGLNFVATGLVIYLILGPWKRAGIASTSGTEPFPREAWLPTLEGLRLAPLAILLAVLAVVGVYLLLRGTYFGLRLRAVGRNMTSSHLLGIPTGLYMLLAFALCGMLAGLAGAVQATGFHHKLVPAVSGGYGYLAILVALLAAFRAKWIAPIALFFAAITIGSTQLTLRLDLDSSLGGVLQGVLVLFTLAVKGWQARRRGVATEPSGAPPVETVVAPAEVK